MNEPKYKVGDLVLMHVEDYTGYLNAKVSKILPSGRYVLEMFCCEDDIQSAYEEFHKKD